VVGVAMVACPVAGVFVAPAFGLAGGWGLVIGAALGPLVGGLASMPLGRGRADGSARSKGEGGDVSAPDVWVQYPHARREMVRETAFLGPCVLLGLVGWWLSVRLAGPWSANPVTGMLEPSVRVPLWLSVLGGVLIGYLVGGGVVWAVRILGSLAFGKEAMGLGDVHLMAAVGACLGWIDSTVAFFLAAFVGVYWAILGRVYSGGLARAMPYGPFLAVATLLVFLGKPVVEWGIGAMAGSSVPVSLP
jgi:leader peptidase (prepilin peptidase)/N-methyltransferase